MICTVTYHMYRHMWYDMYRYISHVPTHVIWSIPAHVIWYVPTTFSLLHHLRALTLSLKKKGCYPSFFREPPVRFW